MRSLFLKLSLILFCINLSIVYSQSCDTYLSKEIGGIILRLDSIHGNVVFDTIGSKNISNNLNVYPLDTSVVITGILSNTNLTYKKCNYKAVCQYLPENKIYGSQLNRDIDSVIQTIYRNEVFYQNSDMISEEVALANKNSTLNIDSLTYLSYLVLTSTHHLLFKKKEYSKLYKRFILHGILEFDRYYLILYHLLVENAQGIDKPYIELIFKDKAKQIE